MAATINNIGVLLGNQSKPQEELAMFQLAVTYNEKACRLAPHSILWVRAGDRLREFGGTQLRLGQPQETLKAYRKRRASGSGWSKPGAWLLRSHYYQALVQVAEQQKQMGLPDEANRTTRDAKEVLASLLRATLLRIYSSWPPSMHHSLLRRTRPWKPGQTLRGCRSVASENADRAMDTLQEAVDKGWAIQRLSRTTKSSTLCGSGRISRSSPSSFNRYRKPRAC